MSSHALALAFVLGIAASAQGDVPDRALTVQPRLVVSSSTGGSEPGDYSIDDAYGLGLGVAWAFHRLIAVEADARASFCELDRKTGSAAEVKIADLDLLAIAVLLHLRPEAFGPLHPYVGAGVNVTMVWRRSAIDEDGLAPSVAPVVQAGADVDLASFLVLNVDVRWNPHRVDVASGGQHLATLHVDPLSVGFGLGFRF